jgi:hypothetical protein
LLGARLFLAAVFVVAALAKVADRAGSRQALRQFGVPDRLTAPLGVALPVAELALAIALLPRTSAWGGAIGALALLLLFSGAIGYSLVRGRTPDCHCFGRIGAGPRLLVVSTGSVETNQAMAIGPLAYDGAVVALSERAREESDCASLKRPA